MAQDSILKRGGPAAASRLPSRILKLAAPALILTASIAADSPRPDRDAPSQKSTRVDPRPDSHAASPEETPSRERAVPPTGGDAPRLALKPDYSTRVVKSTTADPAESSIERAVRTIAECKARFQEIKDYTCVFTKRERIDGKLGSLNIISMKVRNNPNSVYLHFEKPYQGREAIYVAGRNQGLVLAHDVGFTKLLAGTLQLDPRGSRAMQECRHPITEAGIGPLIETVLTRWKSELHSAESVVLFDESMSIGRARCLLVEAIHPERGPNFVFHKVRLFIDKELGFPIRFEGYDWPREPGGEAELVEEYAYGSLKLNVGLVDHDFDAANRLYSFGRF